MSFSRPLGLLLALACAADAEPIHPNPQDVLDAIERARGKAKPDAGDTRTVDEVVQELHRDGITYWKGTRLSLPSSDAYWRNARRVDAERERARAKRLPRFADDEVANPVRVLTHLSPNTRRLAALTTADQRLRVVSETASSDDGNKPAGAIDGNPATRWSASGKGQWLQLDLGAVSRVTRLEVSWYQGDSRQAAFDVSLSVDGKAWTQAYRAVSLGNTVSLEPVRLVPGDARYVRLTGWGNSSNAWNSVTEVNVYGVTQAVPPSSADAGSISICPNADGGSCS